MATREQRMWKHVYEDRQLRTAGKVVEQSRKSARVRQRDWLEQEFDDLDALDDDDYADDERSMPLGTPPRRAALGDGDASRYGTEPGGRERRRERRQIAPEPTGAEWRPDPSTGGRDVPRSRFGAQGTVVQVSTGSCRVSLQGHTLKCTLRGTLSAGESGYTNIVAVGDDVLVSENGSDWGVIETVLPRRTALVRPDVLNPHVQQVIAANVEQLLVVSAWRSPAIWLELIDRYLIAAERNHLAPLLCVNKVDLAEDRAACRAALTAYAQIGYRLLFTSAVTGEGIEDLRAALAGKTTVLAGLSGVGKSSLLAAIQPGLQLRTGGVNERRHEGRHTTTQADWFGLDGGGAVVDTPGIRAFGLSGLRRDELAEYYPELRVLAARCRYSNCSHQEEPGCEVRRALREGRLATSRYDTYRTIWQGLPE